MTAVLYLFSCTPSNDESSLNATDIAYLQELGILNKGEVIELFESNSGTSGIEKSGNFITKERVASYWIDGDEKEIESALFSSEIDSITFTDLITKLTYASYATVYKADGRSFNVYVDADSTRTYQFFNQIERNWIKYRTNK